jgi:hypothetical protein
VSGVHSWMVAVLGYLQLQFAAIALTGKHSDSPT